MIAAVVPVVDTRCIHELTVAPVGIDGTATSSSGHIHVMVIHVAVRMDY